MKLLKIDEMERMIITGQQKIKLNKWEKGIIGDKDLYGFLAARVNEIPWDIGTDADAIRYCINTAIVQTDPHRVINFFSKLPHSRLEHVKSLGLYGL